MTSTAEPAPVRAQWRKRALILAVVTVVYNVLEGAVSIVFGVTEESVALFGFGVDSLIEVASALIVLWRLRGEDKIDRAVTTRRERRATGTIGVLLIVLALVTAGGALHRLLMHAPPKTTLPGLVIAALSLSFMFFLWASKLRVAKTLGSATLQADAACSLSCIKLSAVLFAGSLLHTVTRELWWADATAALVLAVLIAQEGVSTVKASRRADFTGCGCGCGCRND